jgi:ectoine hydroxylase-related dioxygenase (phytanoyl-CoA dioxygenase family)
MNKTNYSLNKDGFTLLPKIFSTSIIDNARKELWKVIQGEYDTGVLPENRFWNKGDDPKNIIKIDKPHLSNKTINNLICDTDFGKILAKITKSKTIQIWHCQSVWKPFGGGLLGNAGWHRDIQYWPFWKAIGVYTAWIAFSNVTDESGPVRFISGSNNWSEIQGLDFFNKDIINQEKTINNVKKNLNIINSNLMKGEISIHTSTTYHSSGPNVSNKDRVGMVVHFCTDRAEKISVKGQNSEYLNQMEDQLICPIIYSDNT